MSKIINERYKGKNLVTSFGILQFGTDGIAEVEEEFVGKLLELKGFSLAQEDTQEKEEVTQKIEPSNPEAEKKEEKKEEKPDFDKLTVPQLKKYAREHGIDLKDANKKVEIIPLLEG